MVWAEPPSVEVAMARPPSVFVRDLEPDEARRIRDLSREGKTFAQRQRAQIVLASASRMSARHIAEVVGSDENQVRRVIGSSTPTGWPRCTLVPGVGAPEEDR